MIALTLPTTLNIGGREVPIRSDFRAAVDIMLAMTDPDLDEANRAMETLDILYEEPIPPQDMQEALDRAVWYLDGGTEEMAPKAPKLVDWRQDMPLIIAPVNRTVGQDVRSLPYLHWWTFLAAYMEIGDCLFAQIVRIRDHKARGKPLDKLDREFYRRNRHLVDVKATLSTAEEKILKDWM